MRGSDACARLSGVSIIGSQTLDSKRTRASMGSVTKWRRKKIRKHKYKKLRKRMRHKK